MDDPFVGTWTLNPNRSAFDPNHRPSDATMVWTLHDNGEYLMMASGTSASGARIAEQPQRFIPDGQPRPVPNLHGLSALTTRPDARTIHAEVRREDGSLVGEGDYRISDDRHTLTATTSGIDTQLRRFESRTVWDRLD